MMKHEEPHGFYWCAKNWTYHVVIANPSRRIKREDHATRKKPFYKEYEATTPKKLVALCRRDGYDIGKPDLIRELCESAPVSPKRTSRLPADTEQGKGS